MEPVDGLAACSKSVDRQQKNLSCCRTSCRGKAGRPQQHTLAQHHTTHSRRVAPQTSSEQSGGQYRISRSARLVRASHKFVPDKRLEGWKGESGQGGAQPWMIEMLPGGEEEGRGAKH